jgi:hypothetical protein
VGVESRAPGAGASGVGPGWVRLATELAKVVPPLEVQGVWVFPAVRREEREWGTAVVARRTEGDRVRVYTARYAQVVRGREKGQGRVEIDEVAECPRDVIFEVLKGVQERMAETELPVEISPSVWYASP